MASEARASTDHKEIRQWAEERGAKPACVRGTGGNDDVGLLRLDFPGYTGEEKLEEISWDEFFEKFDEQGLALLHRDDNFNKLVSRETAAEVESPHRRGRKQSSKARGTGSRTRPGKASKRGSKAVAGAGRSTTARKTAGRRTGSSTASTGRSAAVSTKRSSRPAAAKKVTAKKGTLKKAAGKSSSGGSRSKSTGAKATRKKTAAALSSRRGTAKKSTSKSPSKHSPRGKNTTASAKRTRR